MKLLKKENWWIWLVLALLSGGTSVLVLGALLDLYDKEAWYYRWTRKVPKVFLIIMVSLFGVVALSSTLMISYLSSINLETLSPVTAIIISILFILYFVIEIALTIFQTQIICEVNAKLKTPGSELYLSPYIWILCFIIPIIGWIMLLVMMCYLQIWYLVMLHHGNAENSI